MNRLTWRAQLRALWYLPQRIAEIHLDVHRIFTQGATLMAIADDIKALVGVVNTRTNQIADGITEVRSDLQALKDQLGSATNGISAADADEIKSTLDAAVASLGVAADSLTALGQDETNPVPEPPPA